MVVSNRNWALPSAEWLFLLLSIWACATLVDAGWSSDGAYARGGGGGGGGGHSVSVSAPRVSAGTAGGGVRSASGRVMVTRHHRGANGKVVTTVVYVAAPSSPSGRLAVPQRRAGCTNSQPTCSTARSYCNRNCNERGLGGRCQGDCVTAHGLCMDTGAWQTTHCSRTGLAQK